MATKESKDEVEAVGIDNKAAAGQQLGLRLVPHDGSDQPVLSNVTTVQPTAGVALIDFGFLDPGGMASLQRLAQAGKKVPQSINGRLSTRVALSYEVLANLHRQIGGVLQAVTRQAEKPK